MFNEQVCERQLWT